MIGLKLSICKIRGYIIKQKYYRSGSSITFLRITIFYELINNFFHHKKLSNLDYCIIYVLIFVL